MGIAGFIELDKPFQISQIGIREKKKGIKQSSIQDPPTGRPVSQIRAQKYGGGSCNQSHSRPKKPLILPAFLQPDPEGNDQIKPRQDAEHRPLDSVLPQPQNRRQENARMKKRKQPEAGDENPDQPEAYRHSCEQKLIRQSRRKERTGCRFRDLPLQRTIQRHKRGKQRRFHTEYRQKIQENLHQFHRSHPFFIHSAFPPHSVSQNADVPAPKHRFPFWDTADTSR